MNPKRTKFKTFSFQLIWLVLTTALIIPIFGVLAQSEDNTKKDQKNDSRLPDSGQMQSIDNLRHLPMDIATALKRLPKDVEIQSFGPDHLPTMLAAGNFGSVSRKMLGDSSAQGDNINKARLDSTLRNSVLADAAAVFRLTPDELELQTVRRIEMGKLKNRETTTVVIYRQTKNGLPVVGGELAFIVDPEGTVKVIDSTARGGQLIAATPSVTAEMSREATLVHIREDNPETRVDRVSEGKLIYILSSRDYSLHLAYVTEIGGVRNDEPFEDLVYTDAVDNQIIDVHAQIHSALNRQIYSANNTNNLPGTARRFEGQGASADSIVNTNYDYLGVSYGWYANLFGRDSYNNQGAALRSSVHLGVNTVNAYWNGNLSQFAFGDGDGQQAGNFANSLDVTAHELTHAVTQYSSGLNYQYEPGALNEAWSDIFGAVIEARQTLGPNGYNANTWKVGEDIWTPFVGGDALRYMDDPVRDNVSSDYYPLRYQGGADYGGVHWNSGIANLAFKLTVTGGAHPRGRNNVQVQGIGIDKARQVYYRAGVLYLRPNSNFEQARAATAQAAQDLYGRCNAEYIAVQRAWDAVAVPGTWRCGGGGGGDIHFSTYGGGMYDWHGGGCYDIAQSTNTGTSNIRFQMDAVPFAPNPGTSVARRIGFNFPDTSRPYIITLNRTAPFIQIKTPTGGADTRVSIVGDVNQSATIRFYENSGAGRLLGTIVIYRHGNGVYEYFAQYANGSDIRAYVSPNVVVDASLQPGWNINVRGLAGIYPVELNQPSRWGQTYSVSTLRTNAAALNQFATSWTCPSGQSLFDAPGTYRGQEEIISLNRTDQPVAEQMCESAGIPRADADRFESCVFDVVTGGDEFGQIMATHAGTVWTADKQLPPSAAPDPCAPTQPQPMPSATPSPGSPDPPPVEQTRQTGSASQAVICQAQTETEMKTVNTMLHRLFDGIDSAPILE